ncbi:DUF3040 domain-containing protein [Nonomuraea africana]|uniref:DUF3040 domain-containing protein n=1 Tax=Nonomuraea africana TaxID=46171 RepID=A0ABR9KB61_9ACTN|nr:DUF3040 domain-containing protein [Nonomuraea africana]MBE1559250.1 hypothetical protein [Nonomuraea africana]
MSLSWKEWRSLADLEQSLAHDDPEFVRRVEAIYRVECGGEVAPQGDWSALRLWLARARTALLWLGLVAVLMGLVLAVVAAG